jgi:hypothetical protein
MRIANYVDKFLFRQSFLVEVNVRIAIRAERIYCASMDALEQNYLHLVFGKGRIRHE